MGTADGGVPGYAACEVPSDVRARLMGFQRWAGMHQGMLMSKLHVMYDDGSRGVVRPASSQAGWVRAN